MNTYDINSNKSILEFLVEKALLDTVKWIPNKCSPQEPDYIAALSTKFIKDFLYGVKRNVLPKTINDGAQYLLIDSNPLTNGICFG